MYTRNFEEKEKRNIRKWKNSKGWKKRPKLTYLSAEEAILSWINSLARDPSVDSAKVEIFSFQEEWFLRRGLDKPMVLPYMVIDVEEICKKDKDIKLNISSDYESLSISFFKEKKRA